MSRKLKMLEIIKKVVLNDRDCSYVDCETLHIRNHPNELMFAQKRYQMAVQQTYEKSHKYPHFEHLLVEKALQKPAPDYNKDNEKASGDKKPRTAIT